MVFCPFAWDVPDPKRRGADPDVAYHERADEGYREVLDLAPNEAARGAARVEEFSESLRLLYVALTRAKRRCIVTWGKIKGAPRSPLAWLLHRGPQWRVAPECGESEDGSAGGTQRSPHGPADETTIAREHAEAATTTGGRPECAPEESKDPAEAVTRAFAASPELVVALDAVELRFESLEWSEWRDEVQAFADRCPGAVSLSVLDPAETRPAPPDAHPPPALAAREPARPLRRIRQMTSFSALSAEGARATGATAHALVDRPDHDAGDTPSLRPEREETRLGATTPSAARSPSPGARRPGPACIVFSSASTAPRRETRLPTSTPPAGMRCGTSASMRCGIQSFAR